MDAGDYIMQGVGSVGFDKTVDMKITMVLSRGFSADLIADIREAKYLTNSQGQIEIPFQLTGTMPKVSAGIDGNYVANLIQKALLKDGIEEVGKKLFDDLFGGKWIGRIQHADFTIAIIDYSLRSFGQERSVDSAEHRLTRASVEESSVVDQIFPGDRDGRSAQLTVFLEVKIL